MLHLFPSDVMVDAASMRKEWREIFSSMDQDQSGSISQLELYKFIVKVHKMDNMDHTSVDWKEVKQIFKSLDKDGDRRVDWEEFFVRSVVHSYQHQFQGCGLKNIYFNVVDFTDKI